MPKRVRPPASSVTLPERWGSSWFITNSKADSKSAIITSDNFNSSVPYRSCVTNSTPSRPRQTFLCRIAYTNDLETLNRSAIAPMLRLPSSIKRLICATSAALSLTDAFLSPQRLRPLAFMSAAFSAALHRKRCFGFTQFRVSQLWQINAAAGISPLCSSHDTLCALFCRFPGIHNMPYPLGSTYPAHSQQPVFGSSRTFSINRSNRVRFMAWIPQWAANLGGCAERQLKMTRSTGLHV